MKPIKAFVTGSYAYGIPHAKSDVDLVVFVSDNDMERLFRVAGGPAEYGSTGTISVRFGKLNLLCCVDEKAFEVWKKVTRRLKRKRPVSRDFACKLMEKLRDEAGIKTEERRTKVKPEDEEEDIPPPGEEDIPF